MRRLNILHSTNSLNHVVAVLAKHFNADTSPLLYSSSSKVTPSCTFLHQSYLLHHAYHLILYDNIWLPCGLYTSL